MFCVDECEWNGGRGWFVGCKLEETGAGLGRRVWNRWTEVNAVRRERIGVSVR